MSRFLALDYGTRRVGVAVSDETMTLARPLAVVPASPRDRLLREIARLAADNSAGGILVGRPRGLRGGTGTLEPQVEEFAAELGKASGLPVVFADEALTTAAAHEKLIEAGAGKRKRRSVLDAAAAAVLLQGWLDARGRSR